MKLKWIEVLGNILFWVISAWLIIGGFSIQSQEIELIDGVRTVHVVRNNEILLRLFLCVAVSAAMFYIHLLKVQRLYIQVPPLRILTWSGGIFFAGMVAYFIIEKIAMIFTPFRLPYTLNIGVITFYFMVSSAYAFSKVWLRSEQQRQQLRLEKKQIELNMLRNQLQPHFLFNALNNLLALVDQQKSPVLARTIDQLSRLLRYVVNESGEKMGPLGEEVAFLHQYAALQQLRFEPDEVIFDFKTTGQVEGVMVEPGLLLPFVENAFKYSASPGQQAIIRGILAVCESGIIRFNLANTVSGYGNSNTRMGTGISSTRRRLELIYSGKYELSYGLEDDLFKVKLILRT